MHANNLYREAQKLEKPDGSTRQTYDTVPLLKDIQKQIKREILDRVTFPEYLTGSLKGRDYKANAALHQGAAIVFAEDIGSFFPSTSTEHVFDVWKNFFQFSEEVARCLTCLTTRNDELPQGASTSSQLANLVFWRTEPRLHDRFIAAGMIYSRYVDDVVVSSKNPISKDKKTEVIAALYGLMSRSGYHPKRGKHELKTRRERMTVTKLNVNSKPGIPKEERSRIRAAVRHLEIMVSASMHSAEVIHAYSVTKGKVNNMARFHPGDAASLKARLMRLGLEQRLAYR